MIYCLPRPMPWTLLDPNTGRPVETGNQRAKVNQKYERRRRYILQWSIGKSSLHNLIVRYTLENIIFYFSNIFNQDPIETILETSFNVAIVTMEEITYFMTKKRPLITKFDTKAEQKRIITISNQHSTQGMNIMIISLEDQFTNTLKSFPIMVMEESVVLQGM